MNAFEMREVRRKQIEDADRAWYVTAIVIGIIVWVGGNFWLGLMVCGLIGSIRVVISLFAFDRITVEMLEEAKWKDEKLEDK